jgi:hypothetical protein
MNKLKTIVGSLAALALLSSAACAGTGAAVGEQLQSTAPAVSAAAATPAAAQAASSRPGQKSTSTVQSRKEEPGSSGVQADKFTQVHLQFWNDTNQPLELVSASRGGSNAHWENQAPATLDVGAVGTASSYSSGYATATLVYQGTEDGVQFTFSGKTGATSNTATGQASATNYQVTAQAGTGYNPTDWFHLQPGGTFGYTGQSQQFVVPVGVTQLQVRAAGGSSQLTGLNDGAGGADVRGTLAVTPGQTLDVGVAGGGTGVTGGWGPTVDGDDYSGGDTEMLADQGRQGAGGGATVISDHATGEVLVVAGGGGGSGTRSTECDDSSNGNPGGAGGQDGSWTGGNGSPWPGGGGKAGGNATTQGESSTFTDTCAPGAGGGGVNGGLAGTDGNGAGGGAGSSSAPGLTGSSVTATPTDGHNALPDGNGLVTFSPVTS